MTNALLYAIPVLIWGSTWLAIRFQLGVVDPLVSVVYRFLLAGAVILVYCRLRGLKLSFQPKEHFYIAMQGVFLFGANYWLVYMAEEVLASGLVSIVFSTIVFLNVANGAMFLKAPIRPKVVAGGLVGILGIGLIFYQDLASFSFSNLTLLALGQALLSAFMASLGNIASARNQKAGIPVIQANAFGMLYGGLTMLAISLALGKPFEFDPSAAYISSLIYLTLFGSIIAFGFYLTLLGRIGADKAAHITLLIPIIALILSTLFEDYTWTATAFGGVVLVLSGNFLALGKERGKARYRRT